MDIDNLKQSCYNINIYRKDKKAVKNDANT